MVTFTKTPTAVYAETNPVQAEITLLWTEFVAAVDAIDADLAARFVTLDGMIMDNGDADATLKVLTNLRRVIATLAEDQVTIQDLAIAQDDIPEGIRIINEARRVILSYDGTKIQIGSLTIDENGVSDFDVSDQSAPSGGILIPDRIMMASDRSVTLFPRTMFLTRADFEQSVLSVASEATAPAAPTMAEARDGMIELDPARMGSTLEIMARDVGLATRQYISIPATVTTVPVAGSPTPKILAMGDSITQSETVEHIAPVLTDWGITPTWIGTMDGTTGSIVHEGRSGWATADFLDTANATQSTSVLGSGAEAAYLAGDNASRLSVNPFINGGSFDIANYLSRFSFADPDIVLLNIGQNDISQNDAATSLSRIQTNLPLIIAEIRSSLPSAKILVWFTGTPRAVDGDTRWDEAGPVLKAIIKIVRNLITGGDTDIHLVPTWAVQSQEIGWLLNAGTTDADTGITTTTVSDVTHPKDVNKRLHADLLAAAIATFS